MTLLEQDLFYHRTPLVRWSLYKYRCLWGVGGKGWGSTLQERVWHTYTLRLCYNKIYILLKKKKKKSLHYCMKMNWKMND